MLKKNLTPKNMTEEDFVKAISEKPNTLLSSNSKLSVAKIWSFAIPAAKAKVMKNGKLTSVTTCPSAGTCLDFCYAQGGAYTFEVSMVKHAKNLNFALNHKKEFVEKMVAEIKSKRNLTAIRWHDSGDFFSKEYYMTLREVMLQLPEIKFYAYTKSVKLFENLESDGLVPLNFTYVYSFGGKHDKIIDVNKHRHSKIFSSDAELKKAKYTHSSMENGDRPASDKSIKKIGLVIHASVAYMKMFQRKGLMDKKEITA